MVDVSGAGLPAPNKGLFLGSFFRKGRVAGVHVGAARRVNGQLSPIRSLKIRS